MRTTTPIPAHTSPRIAPIRQPMKTPSPNFRAPFMPAELPRSLTLPPSWSSQGESREDSNRRRPSQSKSVRCPPKKFRTRTLSADNVDISIESMRTAMSPGRMYKLLRSASCCSAEELMRTLRQQYLHADRLFANFSKRFEAMCIRWEDSVIWFTRIGELNFVFAIGSAQNSDDEFVFMRGENVEKVPHFSIDANEISWASLQQKLVDRFDDDDQVRAILAVCMLCFDSDGEFDCVVNNLTPRAMRVFSARIRYDTPIDNDILTVLADVRKDSNDCVYFECASGFTARLKETLIRSNDSSASETVVGHFERIRRPERSEEFEESAECPLPYLYGYGKFLNTSDPMRTERVRKLLPRVKPKGKLYNLLKMVVQAMPRLERNGTLDLKAAAREIAESEGSILGGPVGYVRRITGPVILIGADGLYLSTPAKKIAVDGSLEANFLLFKAGLRAQKVRNYEDKRIWCLSDVAGYLLNEDYTPALDFRFGDEEHTIRAPESPWSDDAAIANSLVALICRKYGLFAGFSSCAASPRHVLRRIPPGSVMDANIFLPVLHVFSDPKHQLRETNKLMWVLYTIMCSSLFALLMSLLYQGDHEQRRERWLWQTAYQGQQPVLRKVESTTVVIHNNPRIRLKLDKDDDVVEVLAGFKQGT